MGSNGVACFAANTMANASIDSACRLTIDATERLFITPHHAFAYFTGFLAGNDAASREMIFVDGATYVSRAPTEHQAPRMSVCRR